MYESTKNTNWYHKNSLLPFPDHNELSETSQPLQVSGAGGIGGTNHRIPYQLSLAKDHLKGEEPITIKDDSKDLIKFNEALALVKDEKQVLILVDIIASKKLSMKSIWCLKSRL